MAFLSSYLNSPTHRPGSCSHGPAVHAQTLPPAHFHVSDKLISKRSRLRPIAISALDGAFLLSSSKAYSQVAMHFGAKQIIIMVSSHWMQMCPLISVRVAYDQFSKTSAAAAAKSLQSCPTLCDPRDGSPPGSPVPGILQARTLEWVAMSSSNAGK